MNWRTKSMVLAVSVSVFAALGITFAVNQGPPRMRRHTANQRRDLQLVEANQDAPAKSEVEIRIQGSKRLIRVNGIPNHKVGAFPNHGNPHSIARRDAQFSVPVEPTVAAHPQALQLGFDFGIGLNGIVFDPGAAEFWMGNPQLGWQYEALGGAVPLGLDRNFAHVQPDGKYHYHGLPTGMLASLPMKPDQHSPLVGWAADGFPIYALYGFADAENGEGEIKEMQPSYRLKSGQRPAGRQGPGGTYDGTFVNDYEFVSGLGDLDECNGRQCITPEYPDGTYAYFLTQHWPTVPRCWRGTPDSSFRSLPPGAEPGRSPGNRRPSRP